MSIYKVKHRQILLQNWSIGNHQASGKIKSAHCTYKSWMKQTLLHISPKFIKTLKPAVNLIIFGGETGREQIPYHSPITSWFKRSSVLKPRRFRRGSTSVAGWVSEDPLWGALGGGVESSGLQKSVISFNESQHPLVFLIFCYSEAAKKEVKDDFSLHRKNINRWKSRKVSTKCLGKHLGAYLLLQLYLVMPELSFTTG